MKTRGLCLIVAAFVSVTARGDLTIVSNVEGSGSVRHITMKLKGDKARVEVSPKLTTIMETKSGDMLTLMNTKKKFVRISADKSKAIAELASKYAERFVGPGGKIEAGRHGPERNDQWIRNRGICPRVLFGEGKLLDRADVSGFG